VIAGRDGVLGSCGLSWMARVAQDGGDLAGSRGSCWLTPVNRKPGSRPCSGSASVFRNSQVFREGPGLLGRRKAAWTFWGGSGAPMGEKQEHKQKGGGRRDGRTAGGGRGGRREGGGRGFLPSFSHWNVC